MIRKAFTWVEAVVVIAIVMILAAICLPMIGHRPSREIAKRSSCQSNLKQIGFGFKQYRMDFDENYPLVTSGKQGWMDILQPYLKSTQIFQCPSDKSGTDAGKSDYFYNSRLAGQWEGKLTFWANTIMGGDGAGESSGNANLKQLPPSWVSDANSPAWRHLEGANYAFADGHVKWFKPKWITASASVVTFAPW